MGNPSSKSSFKNNNLSKQINFIGKSDSNSKYSGIKSADRDNDVLTKFTWNYGGNSVYLTGSFNNWKKNIQMDKQGDEFCITLLLPRQVHQYKFIVDGEWRFSPEDSTMSDDNGYINNYIDTTNFKPLIQENKNNDMDDLSGTIQRKYSKQYDKDKGKVDKKEDYAKYAPKLPPHYEYCLFLGKKNVEVPNGKDKINNTSTSTGAPSYQNQISYSDSEMMEQSSPYSPKKIGKDDSSNVNWMKICEEGQNYEAILTQQEVQSLFKTPHSLPMPTHVTLDHVMTEEGEWYSAMAITQRFKQKYTTFTYYTIDEGVPMAPEKNKSNIEYFEHSHANQTHLTHRNNSSMN